jgi:large conductance mechanosensitive channel
MVLGGVNFNNLRIVIREAVGDRPELALTYGNFIQAVIDFLLIALVVFMMVRGINSFREKREQAEKEKATALAATAPPEVPVVPADIALLTEIRDLLKKKKD